MNRSTSTARSRADGNPPDDPRTGPLKPDGTSDRHRIAGTDTPEPAAAHRAPRQDRGRRRVDEILDAAEALTLEVGSAEMSIQDIARRAGASIGSIYHFFPTKDAILGALRARHFDEVRAMLLAMHAGLRGASALSLRGMIDAVISPLAELVERRPVIWALTAGAPPRLGEVRPPDAADAALRTAILVALRARMPNSTPDELTRHADVLGAIGGGISDLIVHAEPAARRALVGEMARAMYGYLLAVDEDAGRRGGGA